ncbi:hypothetical protein OAQ71_00075 [bacterium]|nr:hypothetical protein [bacterium]
MRIATVPQGGQLRGNEAYRFMGDFLGETACMVLERAHGGRAHSFNARLHLSILDFASEAPRAPLDPEKLLSSQRVMLDRVGVLQKLSRCSDQGPWLEAAIACCNTGEGRAQLNRWSPVDQCKAFWGLFPFDLTRRVDVVSTEVLPGPRRSDAEPAGRFVFESPDEPEEYPDDLRRFARSLEEAVQRSSEFVELLKQCERDVEDLGLADFARCVNVQFGRFEGPAARCEELTDLIRTQGLSNSVILLVGKAAIPQLTFSTKAHFLETVGRFVARWSELGSGDPPSGLVLVEELCRRGQTWLLNLEAGDQTVSPLSLRVVVALCEAGSVEAARLASELLGRVKGDKADSIGSPEEWCEAVAIVRESNVSVELQERLLAGCGQRVLELLWSEVKKAEGDQQRQRSLFRLRRGLVKSGLGIGDQYLEENMALDAGSAGFSFFRRSVEEAIDWFSLLPSAHLQGQAAFEVAMGEWLGFLGPGPWRLGRSGELSPLWRQPSRRDEARQAMRKWISRRWLLRGNPWLRACAIPESRALERAKTAFRVAVLLATAALLGLGAGRAYPEVAPVVKAWLARALHQQDGSSGPGSVLRVESDGSTREGEMGPGSNSGGPEAPAAGASGGEALQASPIGPGALDREESDEVDAPEDVVGPGPDDLESDGEPALAPPEALESPRGGGPIAVPKGSPPRDSVEGSGSVDPADHGSEASTTSASASSPPPPPPKVKGGA